MFTAGKQAAKVLALQDEEGKWGGFHTLSQLHGKPMTTEQALRRLERLGFTIAHPCIQKAVAYMDDCLRGDKSIPDRPEKVIDWPLFTTLILSTWIRRFTPHNPRANETAQKWAYIVTQSFAGGAYAQAQFLRAYEEAFGAPIRGKRLLGFRGFYSVSLLRDMLSPQTQCAYADDLLRHETGIYYIYPKKLADPPPRFASLEASRYLGALELLADYPAARDQLAFAVDWLLKNQNPSGNWDMGSTVNDGIYFPLSDDWRKRGVREADCTLRIRALLEKIAARA